MNSQFRKIQRTAQSGIHHLGIPFILPKYTAASPRCCNLVQMTDSEVSGLRSDRLYCASDCISPEFPHTLALHSHAGQTVSAIAIGRYCAFQMEQGEYCFMSSISMGAYGSGAAGANEIFDFGVSVR